MKRAQWGILGTGNIAAQFATDAAWEGASLISAVGSRTLESAVDFAHRFAIPTPHGSYRDLVADASVDVVYVATPHTMHEECALLAIEHGKHVLVEKPFAVNAAQARRIVHAARASGVFAMEAMWTRFLPHITLLRGMISRGDLGEIRSLSADFGERFSVDRHARAFDPEFAGGALLDLGIYPISLAAMLFGPPSAVTSVAHFTATGVDAQTAVTLTYPHGQMAVLFASIEAHTATRASVNGTRARVEIDGDFLAPADMVFVEDAGTTQAISIPHDGRGLRHQAAEVERCLREGLLESPIMPLDDTIGIMETLDEVRRQIGLRYPADED